MTAPPRPPRLPAALAAAYARTDYEAGGGAVARIGRRSAAVDALLRRLGARQGAFVTAWNPWSRRMPPGWNLRMLARLRAAARRVPRAEGWGRGREPVPRAGWRVRPEPAGAWAERHLLLAADPRRAAVLARRFRQHAIVAVRAGAPARLVLTGGEPAASRPAESRTSGRILSASH